MVMVMMMTRRIGQAATDQMHAVCHALPCRVVLCWLELRFPAGLLSRDHADWSASSDPSSLLWFNTTDVDSYQHLTCSCLGIQVSQDAVAAGYRGVPF